MPLPHIEEQARHLLASRPHPGRLAIGHMRELAATHGDLANRLVALEEKTEALAMNHDTFSHNTRAQLKKVFDALRELMTPPDPPERPIAFFKPEDNASKKTSGGKRQDVSAPAKPARSKGCKSLTTKT